MVNCDFGQGSHIFNKYSVCRVKNFFGLVTLALIAVMRKVCQGAGGYDEGTWRLLGNRPGSGGEGSACDDAVMGGDHLTESMRAWGVRGSYKRLKADLAHQVLVHVLKRKNKIHTFESETLGKTHKIC